MDIVQRMETLETFKFKRSNRASRSSGRPKGGRRARMTTEGNQLTGQAAKIGLVDVMYSRPMIELDCEMWDASLDRSSAGEDSPMLYVRTWRRELYQQTCIGSWAKAQASQ
jgi:hypothetical protein